MMMMICWPVSPQVRSGSIDCANSPPDGGGGGGEFRWKGRSWLRHGTRDEVNSDHSGSFWKNPRKITQKCLVTRQAIVDWLHVVQTNKNKSLIGTRRHSQTASDRTNNDKADFHVWFQDQMNQEEKDAFDALSAVGSIRMLNLFFMEKWIFWNEATNHQIQ